MPSLAKLTYAEQKERGQMERVRTAPKTEADFMKELKAVGDAKEASRKALGKRRKEKAAAEGYRKGAEMMSGPGYGDGKWTMPKGAKGKSQ